MISFGVLKAKPKVWVSKKKKREIFLSCFELPSIR